MVIGVLAGVVAAYPKILPDGLRAMLMRLGLWLLSPLLSWADVDMSAVTQPIARIFLALVAMALIGSPMFRDYSVLFPTRYKITAFFDDQGVRKALAELSESERVTLGIRKDWVEPKRKYLRQLSEEARLALRREFAFDDAKSPVRSKGEVEIEVRRSGGWQEYRIERGSGWLLHKLEVPGGAPREVKTEFSLLDSEANRITVSLGDIVYGWSKVLRPEFKQLVRKAPDEEAYYHRLICVTRVTFFPFLAVGQTIYLFPDETKGDAFPIGYAINTFER